MKRRLRVTKQRKLVRKRRGAIAVMTALLFMSLVACGALVFDFSRLWTVKNELQTSADAGALAGALQLINFRDTTRIVDSARAYARRNRSLTDTVHIDLAEKGLWTSATQTFTPGGTPTNAVRVRVSYNPTHMIMRSFGATVPRMTATAVAWAQAPVPAPPPPICVKPWAIPYESLMFAVNTYRGIANTNANLNRAWDPVYDIAALSSMTEAERTFSLKLGSQNQQGQFTQAAASAGSMPGNFQAVRLPKYWDFGTQSYHSPPPQNGASNYEDWIDGDSGCPTLAVGDSLQTQPGNMVGPTVDGADDPDVCNVITDNNGSDLATHGDCYDANGTLGKDIMAGFYACGSGCSGQSLVSIKLMGSFTLKKMYPDGDGGQNPRYDKAQIVGVFKPIQSGGAAGGSGSTTFTKLVLAR